MVSVHVFSFLLLDFTQRVEGRSCIKLFAKANLILFPRDP